MRRVAETARVVRWAAAAGARDYASVYTWRSWVAGWYVRVLAQVVFFALIGRMLGSDDAVFYLLIGNGILLAAMSGIWALNLVTWERHTGTLPLLVASPSSAVVVYGSRGSYMIVDGTLSAIAALFVAGPLFGLPLPWPRALLVLPLTALVAFAAYAFATFWAGVVIRFRETNDIVVNASVLTLMTLAGVNVPISSQPEPVQWIAHALPLTHGLSAIRDVLAGGPASAVAGGAAAEAAVGLGWLALALVLFDRLVSSGRSGGSLDLGA